MLKQIDFLGPRISLRVKGNETIKSSFGGFTTLFILIASIGTFFGFGIDLFIRNNPQVSFNQIKNENPSYILNHLTFLFAIYDQYSDMPYIEYDRKLVTTMQRLDNDGNGNWKVTEYTLEKCSNETLQKWDGAIQNKPSNYWCLPKNITIELLGFMNGGSCTIGRLVTRLCKNSTTRNDCYSREFIEKNITDRIQMHYILESSNTDTLNYKNPSSSIPFSGIVNTNTNTWNRLTFLFRNRHIETDTGFFISDKKNEIFNGINEVASDSVYTYGTNTIFSHLFGNHQYKEFYVRDYIKVQNIFAQVA